jgi:hypothetical protein
MSNSSNEQRQTKEIRFYFIDGSFSYVTAEEDDYEFMVAWDHLNRLSVFSNPERL